MHICNINYNIESELRFYIRNDQIVVFDWLLDRINVLNEVFLCVIVLRQNDWEEHRNTFEDWRWPILEFQVTRYDISTSDVIPF